MQNSTSNVPAKTATKANTNAKKAKPTKRLSAAESKAKSEAIAAVASARGIARAAATVDAGATAFAEFSDRDTAYLLFFGKIMRKQNGTATLPEIKATGKAAPSKSDKLRTINPHYLGSALSIDAGAINRLIADGYFTKSEAGQRLTATDKALTNAAYNGKA